MAGPENRQLELMRMSKVPPILVEKLGQMRRRERFLYLVWGLARVLSLALFFLLAACLVDWLLDMWDETPRAVREFMLRAQLVLAALAFLLFVFVPQLKRLRNEKLALLVESKRSEFQHRLISALELNRPGAQTAGMSPEMLEAMTREAQEQARLINFAAVADHGRLKRSALLFVPAALVALGFVLLDTDTALALVQRQLGYDIDIPRAFSVAAVGSEIWPSGEDVPLRFQVQGPNVAAGPAGSVRVRTQDDNDFKLPLVFEAATGNDSATYIAKVPPGNADFSYMAKVSDGRTRSPGRVHFVSRPSVIKQDAYVVLPTYVGLRPDGSPYEQEHLRGDIIGMTGLSVRVVIQMQKPVVRAVLETYGSQFPDLSGPSGLTRVQELNSRMAATVSAILALPAATGPLGALSTANAALASVPLRRFEQSFTSPTESAQWRFDLRATETSYRVVVFDEYAFSSTTKTVRSIKIEAERPPTVVLHPERWDVPAAFKSRSKTPLILDFEGMPLPLVDDDKPGPLRISYEAFGPYGIGRAQLKIGVIRGGNDSEADPKKPKLQRWVTLPLAEVPQCDRTFDKSIGAFADAGEKEAVPFYALPSDRADRIWPRMVAGGRLDYHPAGILDEDGLPVAFKQDDQIVVYVEVFNRNPDPNKVLMGKSRMREKDVVSWEKFEAWCYDTLQEASRIEALMFMQQRVYDRPWFSIFGGK
jgi:hypothetical protein